MNVGGDPTVLSDAARRLGEAGAELDSAAERRSPRWATAPTVVPDDPVLAVHGPLAAQAGQAVRALAGVLDADSHYLGIAARELDDALNGRRGVRPPRVAPQPVDPRLRLRRRPWVPGPPSLVFPMPVLPPAYPLPISSRVRPVQPHRPGRPPHTILPVRPPRQRTPRVRVLPVDPRRRVIRVQPVDPGIGVTPVVPPTRQEALT